MIAKNKFGQYFTMEIIADFMVSLISHPQSSKVLEPSCGKGVFLDCLSNNGFLNLAAYEIDSSLETKYDFVKFKSFLSVPTSEKYDVVIGNPPYIRWKNLEQELKDELGNNALWCKYFNSLCDYLFIFILKSIEHLENNGELIFICSEYWMYTTHSASLRNYMCQNGYFEEIYLFKEAPLFEKVTTSLIIFKFVKSLHKNSTIKLYQYNKGKKIPNKQELFSKICFDEYSIPQFKVNSRWVLSNQATQDKLRKFEVVCSKPNHILFDCDNELHRIGEYCDIGNGMVSGLDLAFKIENTDNLNSDERKVLIDVFKAKDLSAYVNNGVTKYIFIQEDISEEVFNAVYPHLVEHFMPYREKLHNRYSYNRQIPYWEFVFPRNQKLFERNEPRIFIPCKERISNKDFFRFCYAPSHCYSTQDVTAIFRKSDCRESLEYILAYLNNERVFSWLRLNGIVKGDIVEFSEAPIASIPFKPINWKSEFEVSIHNQITIEVGKYLKDKSAKHLQVVNNHFNTLFHEQN